MSRLRPAAKIGIVAGGYVLAFVIAIVAVGASVVSSGSVDRHASGGMAAFGDGLLFLAVFAVAAIPPTGAAAVFLFAWWRARR